jgi:ribonuclease BN (tRNA processing enzyme)
LNTYTANCQHRWSVLAIAACVFTLASVARADSATGKCGDRGAVALQILGSGGPELVNGRASSSYLVWVNGHARVLVDLGPGAMLRFGEAGARIEDLQFVGISHLHVDHVADVAALAKAGFFSARSDALPLVGPTGKEPFPGTSAWLRATFGESGGAFRYLAGALDGTGGQFAFEVREVSSTSAGPTLVHGSEGVRVDAIPVPHGIVPSLAFRVQAGGRTIMFGADQNGSSAAFWDFARNADVLVAHFAVPENIEGPARHLHATPGVIGAGAERSGVRRLVLSHLMTRSESRLSESVRAVEAGYRGPLEVARDLLCIPLTPVAQSKATRP